MSSLPPPTYSETVLDKSYVQLTYDESSSFIQLSSVTEFKDLETRTSIDLIAVLDISGSMGTAVKNASIQESDGSYSRFDLVKHAMNVIMGSLSSSDFLTVITFNSEAKVLLPRCSMSNKNVERAKTALNGIVCSNQTNLYDGLKTAFSYMEFNSTNPSKEDFVNRHIMVLTDGCPNATPNQLEATNFRLYSELMDKFTNPAKRSLLHVFGITHEELNDQLLLEIARYGKGMYGFISDPTIITPCFINILAQWFNMLFTGLTLKVEFDDGKTQLKVPVPWILQQGATDITLKRTSASSLLKPAQFTLESNVGRSMRLMTVKVSPLSASALLLNKSAQLFTMRQLVASKLFDITNSSPPNDGKLKENIEKLVTQINLYEFSPKTTPEQKLGIEEKEWLGKLSYDVNVYNRILADSLKLWIKPCLRSLAASLYDDYVTNGYEKSYKTKAGNRLNEWVEFIELVAKNIAQPNPSIKAYKGDGGGKSQGSSSSSYAAAPPSYNYSSNNNNSSSSSSSYFSSGYGRDYDDGCIDGECFVEMADGTTKRVKEMQIGDKVRTDSKSGVGIIRCSLMVPSKEMIELPGGLRLTAMHPIWCETRKDWILPNEHEQAKKIVLAETIDMYSFLLEQSEESSNAMTIQGYRVVHFAHESKHPTLYHEFYGSARMRTTVERLDPLRQGRIRVTKALRDEKNEVWDYEGFAF
jgi:Mg-chelatase subunit ChlD